MKLRSRASEGVPHFGLGIMAQDGCLTSYTGALQDEDPFLVKNCPILVVLFPGMWLLESGSFKTKVLPSTVAQTAASWCMT